MILSAQTQKALERIQEKISRKAIDFKGPELNDLAAVYFEVTQISTGKGRVLSKGCTGCIPTAVHICYNYIQTIKPVQVIDKKEETITVEIDEWADLTKAELWEQIKKRDLSAPATATKAKLIEVLNGSK